MADPKVYWHCFPDEAIGGFGIFNDGQLVSLASIRVESDELLEIGIDSAPDQQLRGMGRAVAAAAGRWDSGAGQAGVVDDLDLERALVAALTRAGPWCTSGAR